MSVLLAGALGVMLGVVTGMPRGVVNVAVAGAAIAGRTRFAVGVGIGGALADTIHASLAFAGVGRVVAGHPGATRVMAIVAAISVGNAITLGVGVGVGSALWFAAGGSRPRGPSLTVTTAVRRGCS